MEYGIKVENDTVVRTSYYKYLHPKHVFIDDGALHPALYEEYTNSTTPSDKHSLDDDIPISHMSHHNMDDSLDEESKKQLSIVYPFGSTITVNSPSLPILSSGQVSFPSNRPIAAIWDASHLKSSTIRQRQSNNRGRILVIGSSHIFTDEWINKEENSKLVDTLFKFLLHDDNDNIHFDRKRSTKDNRVDESRTVPDIEALSERLRSCLEQNEPLPQDLPSLLCKDMLSYDTNLIPDVIELYKALDVKKEPLTLIPPEFERPIPPLTAAVFHPKMKELPPPALDKFDLDEEFAESSVRLAHLTNTCKDEDCEYYIQEAGSLVGLVDAQDAEVDERNVLHSLFQKVCASILPVFRSKQKNDY